MKKTIITILLTSLILYTLGMMTVFAPKAEAGGIMYGPFDVLEACCRNGSVEFCCKIQCINDWCLDATVWCLNHHELDILKCTQDCFNQVRTYCDYAGIL